MRLGELPKGVTRMSIPLVVRSEANGEDIFFVRFACSHCAWTVGFKTTSEGAMKISPEHECPERVKAEARYQLGHKPLAVDPQRDRERQANEQEFGFATIKYSGGRVVAGGTPEVM